VKTIYISNKFILFDSLFPDDQSDTWNAHEEIKIFKIVNNGIAESIFAAWSILSGYNGSLGENSAKFLLLTFKNFSDYSKFKINLMYYVQ